jgi:hypothetical protein
MKNNNTTRNFAEVHSNLKVSIATQSATSMTLKPRPFALFCRLIWKLVSFLGALQFGKPVLQCTGAQAFQTFNLSKCTVNPGNVPL